MLRNIPQFVLAGSIVLTCIQSTAPAQSPSKELPVRVRTVESETLAGGIVSLSHEKGLELRVDDELKQVALADLVAIVQTATEVRMREEQEWASAAGREGVAVEWASGDRVFGRLGDARNDTMVVETEAWGTLHVPLEGVAAVLFYYAGMPAYSDSLAWFRREADSPDDRLLLTNGDVVRGFVLGVGRDGVRIEVDGKESTIPLRLAVAARLVHPPASRPQGHHASLTLADGQRLTVSDYRWGGGAISGRTIRGERVEPPADGVYSIEFSGGRWEWLSERSPSKFEHVPMLSREWKYVVDRNVLGGPLHVAGMRYERGFGVHSKSVLIFDLGSGYREFVTSFGIDDDSGQGANVRVVVLVDGQQRFERSDVVRGKLHGPVRIDVGGAKQLTLEVDFGRNGDIQDRFDWIEPGLVK